MRREVLLRVLGFVLLLPGPAWASKAECRVDERAVPCELAEQCMALGGVLRDRNGALMCCFADERCTEAGSLRNGPRPRPAPPQEAPTQDPGSGSPKP